MPPRSIWKGFLKLSLVSVPVKAYTANASGGEIHLNQLHKGCHSRIKYQKVCPIHAEVSNEDIVSGYQYAKGHYVEIDPEELNKLRSESDKSVKIDGFIRPDDIDPVYHKGKSYYLVPDGPVGQKPYALLLQGMIDEGVHAIAQVVLSGREQLVLLRPLDQLMVMTALSFETQIKKSESFKDEISQSEVSKDELDLTKKLIEATTLEEFELSNYKDAYTDNLTKLIEAKVEGKEIVAAPVGEEPQVINLMEALKESVHKAQQESGLVKAAAAAPETRKKMAPSARQRAAKKRKKKSG